jgi:hypothetical protein
VKLPKHQEHPVSTLCWRSGVGSAGLRELIVPQRGHLISIVPDIALAAARIKRRRQLAQRMDSTLDLT